MSLCLVAVLLGRVLLFGPAVEGGSTLQDPPYESIPHPRLDTLEQAVAEQLGQAQRQFEQATRPGANTADRAEAYGSVARLYHVYEFFEEAEAAYVIAARLAPQEARWPHLLGYLYQQTGRLEEAAEKFAAARRVSPANHAAAVRLGQVYLGLNRLREAREQFDGVIAIFPALAQQGLGEVALRDRRFGDAIAHFRAVLERAPHATSVHYQLAMAYRGLGRLDDARSQLRLRGPGDIRVGDPIVDELRTLVRGERGLVMQGRTAFEAGEFQDAADAFDKALSVAPASVTARANLGLALLQLGDTAKAVEHLRAAFAMAPDDADVSRELLRVLLRLGRQDEAIDVLTKARSVDPDDEDVVLSLSILLANRERYREAVTLLDEANRRRPDRPAPMTTLARLLASSPDRSVRDGRRALELATAVYASEPAPVHAETMAMSLAELGRCSEALEWMRRAILDADRAGDVEETVRLTGEVPRYEAASCGAPGR